ncbi:MAG TPA: hypothetical protein VD884_15335 [Ohtaekwangia sp.]|nr:hypothetical protein [Ohtaekwangia sp.]
MGIDINTTNTDQHLVTILGQVSARDTEKVLTDLTSSSVQSIKFILNASHAYEYLTLQMLAMLRKENKSISLEWVDHKPSVTILSIIESIVK